MEVAHVSCSTISAVMPYSAAKKSMCSLSLYTSRRRDRASEIWPRRPHEHVAAVSGMGADPGVTLARKLRKMSEGAPSAQ